MKRFVLGNNVIKVIFVSLTLWSSPSSSQDIVQSSPQLTTQQWNENTQTLDKLYKKYESVQSEALKAEEKYKIEMGLQDFIEVYNETLRDSSPHTNSSLHYRQENALKILQTFPAKELVNIKAQLDFASRSFSPKNAPLAGTLYARASTIGSKDFIDPNPVFKSDVTIALESELADLKNFIQTRKNYCAYSDEIAERKASIDSFMQEYQAWVASITKVRSELNELAEKQYERRLELLEVERYHEAVEEIFDFGQLSGRSQKEFVVGGLSNYDAYKSANKCLVKILLDHELLQLVKYAFQNEFPKHLLATMDFNSNKVAPFFSKIVELYQDPKNPKKLTEEGIAFINRMFNFEKSCQAKINKIITNESLLFKLNRLSLIQRDLKKSNYFTTVGEIKTKQLELAQMVGITNASQTDLLYSRVSNETKNILERQKTITQLYDKLNSHITRVCHIEAGIPGLTAENMPTTLRGQENEYKGLRDHLENLTTEMKATKFK